MSTSEIHQPSKPTQRRSQRILLRMSIVVSGRRLDGREFSEQTHTLVVNAHGALIVLKNPIAPGEVVTLQNVKSGERLDCRIIESNPGQEHAREVGIAFVKPSPRFWHVAFPPEDWTPRSPEAKRFDPTAQRALKST